jgi:hypothetical protein
VFSNGVVRYQGDIADLGLTFAVTDTSMGGQREVELIPGGASMDVTSQNRYYTCVVFHYCAAAVFAFVLLQGLVLTFL